MLLGIDFALVVRLFALNFDGASADAENPLPADLLTVFQGDELHGVGMRQIGFVPVENDLGTGQPGFDGLARSVPFSGEGEGAVQDHAERVSLGIALAEGFRSMIGTDGMGAGRAVADFIYAFDTLHKVSSLTASPFSALRGKGAALFDGQNQASAFFLPVIAFISIAMAPSPVTLQAVPKESCAM